MMDEKEKIKMIEQIIEWRDLVIDEDDNTAWDILTKAITDLKKNWALEMRWNNQNHMLELVKVNE